MKLYGRLLLFCCVGWCIAVTQANAQVPAGRYNAVLTSPPGYRVCKHHHQNK